MKIVTSIYLSGKKNNIYFLVCVSSFNVLNHSFIERVGRGLYVLHAKLTELILQIGCSRGGSKTAAASKIEYFVIIVNGWKSLTIITKHSILDVAAVLDPPVFFGGN